MMFYPKEDVRFVAVRKPSDKSILRRLSSAYYYHEPHSIYRCRFNPSIDLWNYLGFCDEAGFFYLYDTMFFEQKNDPKLLFKLQLHRNAVCDFAWHPCGRGEVLTGSADERIILTDCNIAKAVQCFHGHSYSIRSLSWCAENTNLFASGGRDGSLRIWDVRLRAGCISTIAKAHYFGDFLTASSSTLCNQKRTNLRKILMSDVRRSGTSLNVPVTGVHFHNQHYVLSGAYTNTGIRIWDLRKLLQANKAVAAVDIWPYPSPRNSNYSRYGYTTFCVDSSRSLLFVPCTDNTVYQYSLSSFNPKPSNRLYVARHTGVSINTYYVQCAVCPYAPYLLCGSSNNKAMIWNINESGDPQFSLNDFEGRDANSVTWNHYGQLVTCCDPPSWRIWTVYSEKQQQQLDMERRNLVLRIQENQRLESLQSERVQQQQQPLEEPIWFASQARSPPSRMQALAPVQSSPMRRYLHQRNKRPASSSPLSTAALDVNQPGPSRPVSSSRAPTTTPARKRVRTTNTYYEIKKHFKFAASASTLNLGLHGLHDGISDSLVKNGKNAAAQLFCLFPLELFRSVMGDKPVTPPGSFFRVYSQDRQYRDLAMTGDKASKLACGPTKRAFDHDVVWATDHPAAGPLLDELVDAMVYAKCDVNVPDDANMSVMMTLRSVNMEKPQIKQDAASGMRSSALDPERMKSVLQAMQKSGAQGVSQDNIDRALQLIELALKEKRAISIHEMEEVLRLVEFNVFIGADGLKQMFERLVNDKTLTEGQANGILQPLLAKAASKADGKLPMQEIIFFTTLPALEWCMSTPTDLHYLFKVMRRSGAQRSRKENIDRALRMIDLVVKEKREISIQEMEEILCIVESNVFIGIDGLKRMFEHLVNKKTLTDAEAIGILPSLLAKAAAKAQKKIPLQNVREALKNFMTVIFTTLVHPALERCMSTATNLHYLFKITVQISNHSVIIRPQCGCILSNNSTNLSDLLYYFNARSLCKKLKKCQIKLLSIAPNNILYPKEDKSRRCLLYACRNCSYVTDDIVSVCVYTNKLRREIDELAQVNVDVIYDPTLPKTDDHSCPLCNNSEAVFFQSQNTKAEPNNKVSLDKMMYYVVSLLSQIYCQGPILDAVQTAHLFPDSKYFVDMALKKDPITTLQNFISLGDRVKDKAVLRAFVDEHFDPPGTELETCFPEDWKPSPKSFNVIKDYEFRRWAVALNRIWKELCRRVKSKVFEHQELYSLLYVPNPFIIPGGRFREFYYWDTFWIAKGLIASEMFTTLKGMIRNLGYMVENHGFVPNGGRVYYLFRSQPPLLIPMVYDYYLATGDIDFLQEMLPLLEQEYSFWLLHRGMTFGDDSNNYMKLFQYKAEMKMPRPESYREDLELVQNLTDDHAREFVWAQIVSGAETGWDFSSRWFSHTGPEAFTLRSIRTWSIIPVDLNAFMCMNTKLLANLYEMAGNVTKVLLYQARFEQAKAAMKQIHWNEQDGIWYDYDLETKRHVDVYYISNVLPLYAKCYDDEDVPSRVYNYLKTVGALNSTRGVPTSFIQSDQQWDSANAWPPMVHMLLEGLRTSGDPEIIEVAKDLAIQWLRSSYDAFLKTNSMFEKYNVSSTAGEMPFGSGGEYEVQTGFGWTNGVILDLLVKYGDVITAQDATTGTINYWKYATYVVFVMKSELKQDEHALKEEILGFMNKIGLNRDGKNKNSSRISKPVRRETKPDDSAWNNNSSGSKNKQHQQQQQSGNKLLPTKIKTEDLNEHPVSESSVQRWYDAKFTDVVGSQPLSEHSLMKMGTYAKQLFQNQAVNYEKETMNKKNNSNQLRWMNSVASGGTLSDRVAALGMLVQQSPLHNLKHLDTLLNKVTKKNRHEALIAADVAKDLFIEELLPDRKLIPFKSRPYVEIENTKGQSKATVDRKLLLWQFESELKMKYQQFLHALEQLCHDTVEAVRLKGCILLVDLLIAKAEQEQFILSSLVNKLGDQSVKVATQVVKLIGRLFVAHPNMKVVVVDELEKLIYRKNITPCAQFYAICALLKVPLNRNNDEDLACKILNVYFDLFKIVIQSDVENQRLLRHLLLGTNVAFSYSKGKFDRISEEVDTLYKIAATSSLYINLQALALLFQVLDVKAEISDRFYRSLYRTMLVPELLSSSRCHAMFFHLLFKSMSQDFSDQRIRAFVKRLLQVCLMAPAPFICAALLVISQALHGRLKRFIAITDQWVEDDHEEQEKVDDEEEKEIENGKKKQTSTESNNTNDNKQNANNIYGNVYGSREYNIAGREPLHANADRESLVELLLLRNHYHPTVAVFAENLLKGNHINYSGNPLDDFSLMHFLDRFVFKNPKKSISENVEEKNTEKRGYKRKIYDPWSLRSLPVTSSAYALHHKSHVPPDEKYLHSFMTNENVKRAEEQLSEESDDESVNSEDEIGNKRRRRRRRRSKHSEDSDDSDNPSDSSGDESDFEAGRSKLNTAALTSDNDDSTDGGVLDDDDATTAAEEFGEILENDDEEDEKKKHDRKRKAYKKFQKMSSPRGTIVVNEMDVADADSWVELSHDSECGSSITFLTDPSGAHGSPHKYTPPGGQTSPVLQFDGDLERVKFQLCRQFSNIQGGKSAWLSDWSSRPEVVPPLQYRRSGTIVRTPPNSPFGSSEEETSDQSKPWFSLRHSRFVRHDWFSLEVLSVYILGNVLSFLFGVCIGLAICRKGRSCCGTHFLP
ncbi:Trehalase [Trichinella nelsoni]|uniref:Trehalase n=1 Tax=Trichinella nelsoni TaxID=6336 RepID=A0A0V0S134_9BILA|nr:Trehalase [Trichinella nelsoni]